MNTNFPGQTLHDGAIAMGWAEVGDGALYPRDPGGQSDEPATGRKAGKIEKTPFASRKDRMRNQNCHFSRPDPFIGQSSGVGNILVVNPSTTVFQPVISAFGHTAKTPTIFTFNPATSALAPY